MAGINSDCSKKWPPFLELLRVLPGAREELGNSWVFRLQRCEVWNCTSLKALRRCAWGWLQYASGFCWKKTWKKNMREKNMGKLWFGVQPSYGSKKMLGRPMTWQRATWTCLNICRWPRKQKHVEHVGFWPLSEGSSDFEPCWRCIKMHDMKLKTPIPTSLLLDAGIISETYLRIGWHSEIKSVLASAVACYTTSACSFGTPIVKSTSHDVHRFTGQQILDPQMMESWPNFKASKQ